MTFNEQMKNKAEEVDLQAKAKDFGDAVAELARTAVGALADLAQQNRDKVDDAIGKAGHAIDERTGGKHADTVAKVQAQVDKGLDKLVEQGEKVRPGVPDDTHSAFDDDVPPTPPASPTT